MGLELLLEIEGQDAVSGVILAAYIPNSYLLSDEGHNSIVYNNLGTNLIFQHWALMISSISINIDK